MPLPSSSAHPTNGRSLLPQHILNSNLNSTTSRPPPPNIDPFKAFSANDLDNFVDSITNKIRNALLGPQPTPTPTLIDINNSDRSIRSTDVFGQLQSINSPPTSSTINLHQQSYANQPASLNHQQIPISSSPLGSRASSSSELEPTPNRSREISPDHGTSNGSEPSSHSHLDGQLEDEDEDEEEEGSDRDLRRGSEEEDLDGSSGEADSEDEDLDGPSGEADSEEVGSIARADDAGPPTHSSAHSQLTSSGSERDDPRSSSASSLAADDHIAAHIAASVLSPSDSSSIILQDDPAISSRNRFPSPRPDDAQSVYAAHDDDDDVDDELSVDDDDDDDDDGIDGYEEDEEELEELQVNEQDEDEEEEEFDETARLDDDEMDVIMAEKDEEVESLIVTEKDIVVTKYDKVESLIASQTTPAIQSSSTARKQALGRTGSFTADGTMIFRPPSSSSQHSDQLEDDISSDEARDRSTSPPIVEKPAMVPDELPATNGRGPEPMDLDPHHHLASSSGAAATPPVVQPQPKLPSVHPQVIYDLLHEDQLLVNDDRFLESNVAMKASDGGDVVDDGRGDNRPSLGATNDPSELPPAAPAADAPQAPIEIVEDGAGHTPEDARLEKAERPDLLPPPHPEESQSAPPDGSENSAQVPAADTVVDPILVDPLDSSSIVPDARAVDQRVLDQDETATCGETGPEAQDPPAVPSPTDPTPILICPSADLSEDCAQELVVDEATVEKLGDVSEADRQTLDPPGPIQDESVCLEGQEDAMDDKPMASADDPPRLGSLSADRAAHRPQELLGDQQMVEKLDDTSDGDRQTLDPPVSIQNQIAGSLENQDGATVDQLGSSADHPPGLESISAHRSDHCSQEIVVEELVVEKQDGVSDENEIVCLAEKQDGSKDSQPIPTPVDNPLPSEDHPQDIVVDEQIVEDDNDLFEGDRDLRLHTLGVNHQLNNQNPNVSSDDNDDRFSSIENKLEHFLNATGDHQNSGDVEDVPMVVEQDTHQSMANGVPSAPAEAQPDIETNGPTADATVPITIAPNSDLPPITNGTTEQKSSTDSMQQPSSSESEEAALSHAPHLGTTQPSSGPSWGDFPSRETLPGPETFMKEVDFFPLNPQSRSPAMADPARWTPSLSAGIATDVGRFNAQLPGSILFNTPAISLTLPHPHTVHRIAHFDDDSESIAADSKENRPENSMPSQPHVAEDYDMLASSITDGDLDSKCNNVAESAQQECLKEETPTVPSAEEAVEEKVQDTKLPVNEENTLRDNCIDPNLSVPSPKQLAPLSCEGPVDSLAPQTSSSSSEDPDAMLAQFLEFNPDDDDAQLNDSRALQASASPVASVVPTSAVTFAASPPVEMDDNVPNLAFEPQTPLTSTTRDRGTSSECSERLFMSKGSASLVTYSAPSSVISSEAASVAASSAPPPPLPNASMGAPTEAVGLSNQITRRSSIDSSTHAEPPSPSTSTRQRSAPITQEQVNAPGLPHAEVIEPPTSAQNDLPDPLRSPPLMNQQLISNVPQPINISTSRASSMIAHPPSPSYSFPVDGSSTVSGLRQQDPVLTFDSRVALPDPTAASAPGPIPEIKLEDLPIGCSSIERNVSDNWSVAAQPAASPHPQESTPVIPPPSLVGKPDSLIEKNLQDVQLVSPCCPAPSSKLSPPPSPRKPDSPTDHDPQEDGHEEGNPSTLTEDKTDPNGDGFVGSGVADPSGLQNPPIESVAHSSASHAIDKLSTEPPLDASGKDGDTLDKTAPCNGNTAGPVEVKLDSTDEVATNQVENHSVDPKLDPITENLAEPRVVQPPIATRSKGIKPSRPEDPTPVAGSEDASAGEGKELDRESQLRKILRQRRTSTLRQDAPAVPEAKNAIKRKIPPMERTKKTILVKRARAGPTKADLNSEDEAGSNNASDTPTEVESKGTPVESKCTPVESKCTPVESKCTPVESKCTPVESKCTPVESKCTPVESKCTPVESKGTPIRNSLPRAAKRSSNVNLAPPRPSSRSPSHRTTRSPASSHPFPSSPTNLVLSEGSPASILTFERDDRSSNAGTTRTSSSRPPQPVESPVVDPNSSVSVAESPVVVDPNNSVSVVVPSFKLDDVIPILRLHQHNSKTPFVPPQVDAQRDLSSSHHTTTSADGVAPKPVVGRTGRRKQSDLSQLPPSLPPVTRSHCHFIRLKFNHRQGSKNPERIIDTFFIPQCATGNEEIKRKMKAFDIIEEDNLTAEEQSRGIRIGHDGRKHSLERFEHSSFLSLKEEHHEFRVDGETLNVLMEVIGLSLIQDGQVEALLPADYFDEHGRGGAPKAGAEEDADRPGSTKPLADDTLRRLSQNGPLKKRQRAYSPASSLRSRHSSPGLLAPDASLTPHRLHKRRKSHNLDV